MSNWFLLYLEQQWPPQYDFCPCVSEEFMAGPITVSFIGVADSLLEFPPFPTECKATEGEVFCVLCLKMLLRLNLLEIIGQKRFLYRENIFLVKRKATQMVNPWVEVRMMKRYQAQSSLARIATNPNTHVRPVMEKTLRWIRR